MIHTLLHAFFVGLALFMLQAWIFAEIRARNSERGFESARELTESIYRTVGRGVQPAYTCRWKAKYRNWRGELE